MVRSRQRQRQLARQKWERQQQRRAQRYARTKRRAVVGGVVVLVVAVLGGGVALGAAMWSEEDSSSAGDDTASAAPTPERTGSGDPDPSDSGAPSPTAPGECRYVETGEEPGEVGLPPARPELSAFPEYTITTDRGAITGELFGETAPCAVASFAHLAKADFFDETACTELATRPAPVRYLGCGAPAGSTSGPGYHFATEGDTSRETYEQGLLVLADGGDRGGSRFLLTYGEPSKLTDVGTVFGTVKNGLDIVTEVAKAGVEGDDEAGTGRPATPLVIEDVEVTTR